MKVILVSQRIDIVNSYEERRDALDQRWTDFLLKCDLLPLMLPNNISYFPALVDQTFPVGGVLLTGGNSLVKYGGDAPERDCTERFVLEYAIKHSIPVIGVCRGMQLIQDYFGQSLTKIQGHVACRHRLKKLTGSHVKWLRKYPYVNSYHDYGANSTVKELQVTSRSEDGVVMSVEHIKHQLFGYMWHPEREHTFSQLDIALFKNIYGII